MAEKDELKDLAVRLENLEAKLETVSRRPKVDDLSEADIAAYHKVQLAFWEDGAAGSTRPARASCDAT